MSFDLCMLGISLGIEAGVTESSWRVALEGRWLQDFGGSFLMSLQGFTQHMPGVQHSIKLRIKGIITCFASLTSKLLLCIGKLKVFKNSLSSNAVQMLRQ